MDEYDEMYGIEDDFEQQFADELEVLADMDFDPCPVAKVSELRTQKPQQSFEEAIAAGDAALPRRSVAGQQEETEDVSHSPSPGMEEPLTPLPKRRKYDVAKKLKFESTQVDDITPPSSPEAYEGS
ncbi:chromosome transmission fidelity protein 18 homolog, partial [Alosa pseudoharengus]|uniref:chromosome transmission fidelity protein 18 homolog n=1 Tax=Alosa pseudoharengus TaxID=34774 RepID=UPI003F8A348E